MNSTGIRKKVLACAILFLTISFPFMAVWADEPTPAPTAPAPAPATPTEDACKPTATFSTDILSQYIFRGAALKQRQRRHPTFGNRHLEWFFSNRLGKFRYLPPQQQYLFALAIRTRGRYEME